MPTRVKIDTDELRTTAQYLQGALEQLDGIRADLMKVGVVVDEHPDRAVLRQRLLNEVFKVGAALTEDHDLLAAEILDLEAEEGPDTATVTIESATPLDHRMIDVMAAVMKMAALGVGGLKSPSNPPEPWDKQWVNPDGSVPPGPTTSGAGAGAPSTSASASFGKKWEEHGEVGDEIVGASGQASASASGWAYGEAYSGMGEDGQYHLGASGRAGIKGEVSVEGEAHAGPVKAEGKAHASAEAEAHASADLSVGTDGINAEGQAGAHIKAEAAIEGSVDAGSMKASGEAHVKAEAYAEAAGRAHIGSDGVHAEASYGAGASVEAGASGEAEAGGVSTKGGVSVKAGVEASGNVGGHFDSEGFNLKLEGSLALGLGLGIDLDLDFEWSSLNPITQLEDAFNTFVDSLNPLDELESLATGIEDLFSGEETPEAVAAAASEPESVQPSDQPPDQLEADALGGVDADVDTDVDINPIYQPEGVFENSATVASPAEPPGFTAASGWATAEAGLGQFPTPPVRTAPLSASQQGLLDLPSSPPSVDLYGPVDVTTAVDMFVPSC